MQAVVACTSLHHVADLGQMLDLVTEALVAGGVLVVVEWAYEPFDETTAQWCFARLADGTDGWLHWRKEQWRASGQPWDSYCRGWAESERQPTGQGILAELDMRFDRGGPLRVFLPAPRVLRARADEL